MTLTHLRNSYRWSQAIPRALQSRFGCGQDIQKSLTTRDSALAHSFAAYLTETARRLFTLVEMHSALNGRELGLLVQNLKRLTDIVEVRDGHRSRSKYFENELKHLVEENNGRLPSRPVLSSLQDRLRSLSDEFTKVLDRSSDSEQERGNKRLSETILSFLRERSQNWRPHTAQARRSCLRALLLIVGDQPMAQITRTHLAQFKELTQRLPVHWEHRYPGVPIAEIIGKEHRARKLQPGTINGYIAMAHTFFEWAYVNGFIPSNPARKLKIQIKDRIRDQRSRLYATDLRQIFEDSLYFSRDSTPASIAARKSDPNTLHLFWIPLIALFSGMRAGEIAGLERQDLCLEDRVWCFRVRPNGMRDIKSLSSNRIVPIHPMLLKMGIVKALTGQDTGPHESLWPQLSRNSMICSAPFTRIWSKYRKDCGIYDAHKTFHSFRHTFIHALSDVTSHVDIIAEIAGHSLKSEFFGRYRKRADVRRLFQAISRIKYPCEMDHLHTAPAT